MDAQEIAGELAQPGAQELLATTAAHLAYTAADGTPRVIPVGFFWTGDQVVIASATSSPKVATLSARPDVAVSIDGDAASGARALSIRGRASVEIVDGLVEEYVMAARRSMDAETAERFVEQCRKTYTQGMARIAITPSWARFYDFGAGRLPRFLQELVEAAG